MNKLIVNPAGLTFDDLQNNDWEVVKLDITIDTTSAMEWVKSVEENNQDAIWTFDRADLVAEEHMELFLKHRKKLLARTETNLPAQWGLQWSYQRGGAIPFIMYACKKQFPEILEEDFLQQWDQNLEKYYFGFWKRYYEFLGPDVFHVTRLVKFPKGCGLHTHKDTGQDQPFLIRMHTIPEIGSDTFFNYGEDMEDTSRQYKLEPGCTYLLNTGILHSAINYDNKDWWMLHNNPTPHAVTKLLNTKAHIE
jgi:hypothetical protein